MTDTDGLVELKVVCPHCWHEFYADQAMYISRHSELYGDPVLGDQENKRFAPNEAQRTREGDILDPKGWKMIERACPVCHLQVPPDLLVKRGRFVSVVGPPRSGKTYFVTAMIHGLRAELPRYFGYALGDSDSHEIRAFLRYEATLFAADRPTQLTFLKKTDEVGDLYNDVMLDGAKVRLPKPFIFALQPTASNVDAVRLGNQLHQSIVLYDNAGESFEFLKERSASDRVTQHLAQCDAVLFAFDPLQDPNTRNRLRAVSQDPQLTRAVSTFRQEATLQEVVNRIRRHRGVPGHDGLEPVLAVCVQKYDVWKTLVAYNTRQGPDGSSRPAIDHTSVEYDAVRGIGGIDIEEINQISLLVRGFLEDICPQFVAMAEANFKIVRYFPVSALGTSPEYDDSVKQAQVASDFLKVRPANLQPFRMTHPMLWLLSRWQLIRRKRPASTGASKYPHAQVHRVTEQRMRVVGPTSGRIMVLDTEYSNSSIIDPFDGHTIWIPAVAKAVESPKPRTAAPVVTQATEVKKPTLTLDGPTKQRRGWFRK